MSGLFNRLKSRKSGSNHTNNITPTIPTTPTITESEPTSSACAFDEEGFLCPICLHKFNDHTELAQHYTETHVQEPVIEEKDTNDIRNVTNHNDKQEDLHKEVALWKQQFISSEESRMLLSNELLQQKQRADDLEEERQLLKKHLKSTQTKVAEQSQEVANLKATKDVYDAQLTIFTTELLNTKEELREKQNQVATLCNDLIPRSTNDDVDVLKRELITVQQHMNEMSLEKEQQIEKLRISLTESYQFVEKLDHLENVFNQNVSVYDEVIGENTLKIGSEINQIKQFIRLTRQRKEKLENNIKHTSNCLIQSQTETDQLKQTNTQLQSTLEQQKQSNNKLTNDLHIEQKQSNSYRNQIDTLNNEIHQLEKSLNKLKEEKNQLIHTKMDGDQDNERQKLLGEITQEKNQYEEETKDLRIQIKQINHQRQQIQDEFDGISKQLAQITNEKNQLQNEQIRVTNEMDILRKQLDDNNKDQERRVNELKYELSTVREQYTNVEKNLQKSNELHDYQNKEIEQLKTDITNRITRFKQEKNELQQQLENKAEVQLNTMEKEKYDIQQQLQIKQQIIEKLQTTLSQLHDKLDKKDNYITRLSTGIRRSLHLAHKTQKYFQENIHTNQINLLATIEQAEQESRSIRVQTLEEIREEFTFYLTIYHSLFTDNKSKLEKQCEQDNFKLINQQEQSEKELNTLKHKYEKLTEEYDGQKQKFQIQSSELNRNLLKVTDSLSEVTQKVDIQREKYEKQITSLQRDLEFQTKKHEMQLSALRENLATVRNELKTTNEKLTNLEHIKAEKADTDARLVVSQEERRVLLERSLTNESKTEKLIFENSQLIKKNIDLDAALQEIAREFQVLQIQTNKLSHRRWLNDDDVHSCMKCHQTFSVTQRKHHCRNCGNIFCDPCSSKTAIVAAASKKPQRVCDQCHKDLTS